MSTNAVTFKNADLVGSGNRVVVTMEHTAKGGAHKILDQCTLPLTGKQVVDRIITELGVFDIQQGELCLMEIANGVEIDDIRAKTGCAFKIDANLKSMED